jgi:hypothetical protein
MLVAATAATPPLDQCDHARRQELRSEALAVATAEL